MHMRRIVITVILALVCSMITNAQNIVRKGNMFIEQPREATTQARKTDSVYIDKDGNKFPIYKSAKGKLYVIKVSKKSGKEYRKYITTEKTEDFPTSSTKKPVKAKN